MSKRALALIKSCLQRRTIRNEAMHERPCLRGPRDWSAGRAVKLQWSLPTSLWWLEIRSGKEVYKNTKESNTGNINESDGPDSGGTKRRIDEKYIRGTKT